MPSWASAEANSRADSSAMAADSSASRCRLPRVSSRLVSAAPCGEVSRISPSSRPSSASRFSLPVAIVMRPARAASSAPNVAPVW